MNKENLLKLAKFLDGLPEDYEHFDMSKWIASDTKELRLDEIENVDIKACGYAACAIGHAPQALKLTPEETWKCATWNAFIHHYFDIAWIEEQFMFGVDWQDVDNTPKGVAKRIRYFLENGVPDSFGFVTDERIIELYEDY